MVCVRFRLHTILTPLFRFSTGGTAFFLRLGNKCQYVKPNPSGIDPGRYTRQLRSMQVSQLNRRQVEQLQKIIGNDSTEILHDLLGHYLSQGLGAVTKKEMETYLYYLFLRSLNSKGIRFSNYEWSCLLKVPESKVRSLSLDASIRFGADDDNYELELWLESLEAICAGNLEKDKQTEWLVVTIENPAILRFISQQLKSRKAGVPDYSLNPERVKFSKDALLMFLNASEVAVHNSERLDEIRKRLTKIKFDEVGNDLIVFLKESVKAVAPELFKIIWGARI